MEKIHGRYKTMSNHPENISLDAYMAGIDHAREQGLITIAPHYAPSPGVMKYSNHVPWEANGITFPGKLSLTNTRPLHPVIKLALNFFKDETLRYLELGPGAGNASYELYRLSKVIGQTLHIHTASYTPINPFMPMVLSGSRLQKILTTNSNLNMVEEGPQGSLWFISTQAVFDTQKQTGIKIFDSLEEPYINRQYIGEYPKSPALGNQPFNLIYDMLGPLHGDDHNALRDAYARLSDDGLLFFLIDPRYHLGETILDAAVTKHVEFFDDTDLVVVDVNSHSVLIAKGNSKIAHLLKKETGVTSQTTPTLNITGLMQWMVRQHLGFV